MLDLSASGHFVWGHESMHSLCGSSNLSLDTDYETLWILSAVCCQAPLHLYFQFTLWHQVVKANHTISTKVRVTDLEPHLGGTFRFHCMYWVFPCTHVDYGEDLGDLVRQRLYCLSSTMPEMVWHEVGTIPVGHCPHMFIFCLPDITAHDQTSQIWIFVGLKKCLKASLENEWHPTQAL